MSSIEIDDQYFTYEGRLASFQKSSKKRGSTANGRKALTWPHKQIAPARLAKAGFFFNPAPENPDNVTCFLCHKGLDGWEEDDDPSLEHIKHSSHCGWAIVSAVEAGIEGYELEDSTQPLMVEARKATFAGRWPHEGKRGWKCKTKQLADAGWNYTPSAESDDMATCAYCQLALDGWEPSDKPYDEHYNRVPECRFFALSCKAAGGKQGKRTKAKRASKASRLSMQSVTTAASDLTTMTDATAAIDDSVLTTASTMTQGEKKTRGKKSTAGKGRGKKSKAAKDEPTEVEEAVTEVETFSSPPKPAKKATRGKKRPSEDVDESTLTAAQGPAKKRRSTAAGGNTTNYDTTGMTEDTQMTDVPKTNQSTARKTSRSSAASKKSRKLSSRSNLSLASMTSLREPPEDFPDDDEIERQLQADLERQFSEDEIAADPETKRANLGKKQKQRSTSSQKPAEKATDYAMFDPAPVEVNADAVEDELKLLEHEMKVEEEPAQEPEQLQVPKKGRKAGPRKASKQTKSKKPKAASPDPLEEPARAVEPEVNDDQEALNFSVGSTDTVVRKEESLRVSSSSSISTAVKSKQKRVPSKTKPPPRESSDQMDLVGAVATNDSEEAPPKRGRGRPSKESTASAASNTRKVSEQKVAEPAPKRGRGRPPKVSEDNSSKARSIAAAISQMSDDDDDQDELAEEPVRSKGLQEVAASKQLPQSPVVHEVRSPIPPFTASSFAQPPSTPGDVISPVPSARQAAISPSQSPQASDAENQPPSSVPDAGTTTKRIALAPISDTPIRGSPSKRNVIAGLQSATPWTAMDLDAVLGTPRDGAAVDKENGLERFLKRGSDLTSPEKGMTVEEWIYFNAGEAEKKLKHECETMVSRFESEGTRAMNVLEGLAVE